MGFGCGKFMLHLGVLYRESFMGFLDFSQIIIIFGESSWAGKKDLIEGCAWQLEFYMYPLMEAFSGGGLA